MGAAATVGGCISVHVHKDTEQPVVVAPDTPPPPPP
jgi:hypothetical protein